MIYHQSLIYQFLNLDTQLIPNLENYGTTECVSVRLVLNYNAFRQRTR